MSTAETTRINKELAKNVNDLVAQVASKPDSNYRDRMHVQAVLNWSRGDLNQAAQSWEDVLVQVICWLKSVEPAIGNISSNFIAPQYPTDILAIKMVADTYFFLGKQRKLRDSVARVMPFWSSRDLPLKSYLHGMYAFGLVETNFYAKAEIEARKVRSITKNELS